MFIDFAEIYIKSGDGGNGVVAWRKEKFIPKGGPAGGDGGRGGNIIFKADSNLHTLMDFRYTRKYEAKNGVAGSKSKKDGKNAENIVIKVPVGTIIKEKESGRILVDLEEAGTEYIAAKGGKADVGIVTL